MVERNLRALCKNAKIENRNTDIGRIDSKWDKDSRTAQIGSSAPTIRGSICSETNKAIC